jgi:hypothetical protein
MGEVNPFDRSVRIVSEAGQPIFVSHEVARNLLVE